MTPKKPAARPRAPSKPPAQPTPGNALKHPQNRWQRTVRYVWNGKRSAR